MDYQTLRHAAKDSMNKAPYNPKKLALLHILAIIALSLLLTVVNFFLSRGVNSTSGIGGLGNRAIWETAQVSLSLVNLVITPMWSIGFLAVALRTARWSNAEPGDLLDGFRHWGTVLRLYLLQFLIYMLVAFACSQVATILYSFTPFIEELSQIALQTTAAGQSGELDLLALMPSLIPMYIIFFVLFAIVAIPLFYRFRMSFFAVAEGEQSARRALGISTRLMRGKRVSLFKLDLHFWWYYGAQLLLAALGYAGTILDLTGLTLPVSRQVVVYGAYGIYLVLHLILGWQLSLSVETTYAHCYDQLKAELPPEPAPQSGTWTPPWQQQPEED